MSDAPPREVVIFTEALKLTPSERALYVAQACWGDEHLRLLVEALLRAHDQAGDFMELPPPEAPVSEPEDSGGDKPG